ncbi:MAG: glycoside hydrolase family 57 protein [Bacteroidales bacterium]|jgi:alpha-amylase|nr:glycoside hydrolase family 57 protein [Bacteroidales bacterium]
MKAICFCFQVHQPFRFRRYRFFDIGNDHYYYDDFANDTTMRKMAESCYLPANKLLMKILKKYPKRFKVSFAISGTALDQFCLYAPEVLESFRQLAATGQIEFLSGTYSHSLASLYSQELFAADIKKHDDLIVEYFGQQPTAFCNTEFIYNDEIGAAVAALGFKAMLAEGAKHVLGWKSPNFLYCNTINPRLKVLMRNFRLSDDLAFRFSNTQWSEYPLTADKFASWLLGSPNDEIFNLFMNYETFGVRQPASSGIFDFLASLPAITGTNKILKFATPSEIASDYQPVAAASVPNTTSWADEERDLTAWLGNEMQQEAARKLYELAPRVAKVQDAELLKDWEYLQSADHFYYICTKFFSDGEAHRYSSPYSSPYEAFINYMNVLNDFSLRLSQLVPENDIEYMRFELAEKDAKIEKLLNEVDELTEKVKRLTPSRKRKA